MTSRIVTATLLAALFNVLPASGQDESRPPPSRTTYGMLLDGGERREPTVEEALYALTTERYGWPLLGQADVHAPVVAILRQIRGPRPEAELNSIANAVADMILADDTGDGRVRSSASRALRRATSAYAGSRGTPHQGSFNALVRVYETRAAQALAGTGGNDPFLAAERSRLLHEGSFLVRYRALRSSLNAIFLADSEGRGRGYVLDLYRRSEPPPARCGGGYATGEEPPMACPVGSTWCAAGNVLYGDIANEWERRGWQAWEDGAEFTEKLQEPVATWHQRCLAGSPRSHIGGAS